MTAEELRNVLRYDPKTGEFFWIARCQGRKLNGPAGTPDERGYIRIHISGHRFTAHRLAMLYVNGEMPDYVDHINGNRSDNRLSNLRVANKSENGANAGVNSNNTTGFKGVSLYQDKYAAYITVRRQRIHLGYFITAEEAHAAYCHSAKKHFGEFARFE
jgi:HNH endonuclease